MPYGRAEAARCLLLMVENGLGFFLVSLYKPNQKTNLQAQRADTCPLDKYGEELPALARL